LSTQEEYQLLSSIAYTRLQMAEAMGEDMRDSLGLGSMKSRCMSGCFFKISP
jgi:hypothetical protein